MQIYVPCLSADFYKFNWNIICADSVRILFSSHVVSHYRLTHVSYLSYWAANLFLYSFKQGYYLRNIYIAKRRLHIIRFNWWTYSNLELKQPSVMLYNISFIMIMRLLEIIIFLSLENYFCTELQLNMCLIRTLIWIT